MLQGLRRAALAALCLGFAALGTAASPALADDSIPTKPEAGTFKLGLEPWLGYGQWQIAATQGIFAKNGLQVDLVNFTQDKDINSIADLKGKQVAFEQGTTSDILLNYALQANGMTIADVQVVPMPASDAGSALIAKRVPVSVTYEPYLTVARKQDPNVKLLYTAGEDPGLVSDVLVIRDEVLKSKPGQVLALVESWDQALQYYKAHTQEGRDIIAKSVGSTLADLQTAFDGVRYYSLAENKQALEGDFAKKTFADVLQAAKKAGILNQDVSAAALIDARFVDAAK